jgi:hypothetical protein
MAEKLDEKELVSFEELLKANSIQVDTVTQLLIEKAISDNFRLRYGCGIFGFKKKPTRANSSLNTDWLFRLAPNPAG